MQQLKTLSLLGVSALLISFSTPAFCVENWATTDRGNACTWTKVSGTAPGPEVFSSDDGFNITLHRLNNEVVWGRRDDNSGCFYDGLIDGNTVTGTDTCANGSDAIDWTATITP